MTFDEYQEFCKQKIHTNSVEHFVFGLVGETGEVVNVIKKGLYYGPEREVDITHLKEELGDVMWYLANIASHFNLSLKDIVIHNKNKVTQRYLNADLESNIKKLTARHGGMHKSQDKNVGYRVNGPHIEMYDKNTGKHIKFCKKDEVPIGISEKEYYGEDSIPPWKEN